MKRVITYGTFDLFHQGHYNILKRARELGDYLIVGVTSESYDIERHHTTQLSKCSPKIYSCNSVSVLVSIGSMLAPSKGMISFPP